MSDDRSETGVRRRSVLQTVGGAAGIALLGAAGTTAAVAQDGTENGQPRYQLPELPYEYDALEPHIDERIMELHHTEHHQAYVDGANDALEEFEAMRDAGEFDDVRAAKRDFSFNLSGHVNHTIFWENMSPDGGGEPEGTLATAIDENFGSFADFQAEFTATANNVEGDGWAMVFYEPLADALVIGQVEGQNELAHQRAIPILTLDVWEHAYYLQYENDRGAYVDEWWNVVDWADVERRYELLTDVDAPDLEDETPADPDEDEPEADEPPGEPGEPGEPGPNGEPGNGGPGDGPMGPEGDGGPMGPEQN
ncbi:superoxide dismutase [Natronolimnohabitans sp. A-GB9]|uniref:superoxide dismutase n=1 Tax=Natronolimnohabitans sp. A-GB9 TaxID=3069757 RepID=UPI0027B2F2B1|nr:superoxide dismutase [Natronolimnohabitans sp. A-GB9]MDQ2048882.1 superoxide dismutase [Natronolimnohabitans sp. A-GB9]